MRNIEGFVVKARYIDPAYYILYGQNPGPEPSYANILSNGLTPFDSVEKSLIALQDLSKRNTRSHEFSKMSVAKLKIKVALTEEEIAELSIADNLITIMEGYSLHELFGRWVNGAQTLGYLPGAFLTHNGFKPFRKYEDAIHSMEEIMRQGASPAKLATFSLKNVNP